MNMEAVNIGFNIKALPMYPILPNMQGTGQRTMNWSDTWNVCSYMQEAEK